MIHYEISDRDSDLPWVTLVHGFTHNLHYWDAAIPSLERSHRVLRVDLRGHGGSSILPGPYGIVEYATDILDVFDTEGIDSTAWWATHTGTAVGLDLAVSSPGRINRLALEGVVVPGFPMPRTDMLRLRIDEIARRGGVSAAIEDWFENADWFEHMRDHPVECRADEHQALLASFQGGPLLSTQTPTPVPDAAELLAEIAVPTLLYNGESDLPEFLDAASFAANRIPNARVVKVPDAGGFPLWENPGRVLIYVTHFLEEPSDLPSYS